MAWEPWKASPVRTSSSSADGIPFPGCRDRPLVVLDGGFLSAGFVHAAAAFIEPGAPPDTGPTGRAGVRQPIPDARSARKPPRHTLRGEATFYDHGTTAMRLPRGRSVIICVAGGCIERVVNDYGPQTAVADRGSVSARFLRDLRCPSWVGVVDVTVHVY